MQKGNLCFAGSKGMNHLIAKYEVREQVVTAMLLSSSTHQDIEYLESSWMILSRWRERRQHMMSEVIDLERVVSAGRKGSRWSELTLLHPRPNTQDKDHFLIPLSFIWSRIYTQTLFYLNSCMETLQENCRGVESFLKMGRKKLMIGIRFGQCDFAGAQNDQRVASNSTVIAAWLPLTRVSICNLIPRFCFF